MKVINNLNVAKSCQTYDIPTNLIKINKDIFANFSTDHFTYCIAYADVIPVHKKMKSVTKEISENSDQHFKNL